MTVRSYKDKNGVKVTVKVESDLSEENLESCVKIILKLYNKYFVQKK